MREVWPSVSSTDHHLAASSDSAPGRFDEAVRRCKAFGFPGAWSVGERTTTP